MQQVRSSITPYPRQVCASQITTDTYDDLSPIFNGEIPFQPNPQKAELEAPEALHRHYLLVSHGHIQYTLIQKKEKAFVVGLFKPRTQVEEKKLPLVSWFRLSEEFSVLHMPHLLLANRCTTWAFLSVPVIRHTSRLCF